MYLGALNEVVGMRREIERYEHEAGVLEMLGRKAEGNLRTCHGVHLYRRLRVERWLHGLDEFIKPYRLLKYSKELVGTCGEPAFTC
jgi:hypothetical protein